MLRIFQYAGFFLMGIVGGMTGPLIPSIRHDLDLGYGAAGLLFSAQSTGGLVVLLLAGWFVHVLGAKKLLFGGAFLFSAGLLASAVASDLTTLLIGNIGLGVGMSLLDVGISTATLDANPNGKGKALNLLHFFFGFGAVVGPLLAWSVADLTSGWRWAFGLSAVLPFLLLFLLFKIHVPPSPPAAPKVKFAVYKRPVLWWVALALCVYCGVEWGVGAWLPSYWTVVGAGLDPNAVTSFFWITFSVGRFIVGRWADRWGFPRFLAVSMGATGLVLVLWLVVPGPFPTLAAILLLGFTLSGIYPTFVALASQKFPSSSGQVASFLSIFAAIGTLLWPPVMGFWADASNILTLPWAELVFLIFLLGTGRLALMADRKQNLVESAPAGNESSPHSRR